MARPAGVNGSVRSTAVAMPRCSSTRPSCMVQVLHDPQSPIAVITTSACSASTRSASSSAGTLGCGFITRTTPSMP